MEVQISQDHEEASAFAADLLTKSFRDIANANVIVATGNTPIRSYELLAERLNGASLNAFQLDEYFGIGSDDERSLYSWMLRSFVKPLNIPVERVYRLDGSRDDFEEVCRAYEQKIDALGGIDVAILGLGPNGHLGFNEPPSPTDSPTRLVELTAESIASNAVYWSQAVPKSALTVGMRQILKARLIVLIATGKRKRQILDQALYGPISPEVPASQLRLAKGRVVVVCDRDALGGEP